jgi:G protein beta subunit-like protein
MSISPVILVTGGYDHKIRFWDATSGVCSRSINFGESQINVLAISNDKNFLAAGGNPFLHLYDINSIDERPILSYDHHTNNITGLGFQHDARWLYTCSEDGSVRIWDPRTNTTSRKYECGCSVNTVSLHPNESMLISGDSNGYVRIWDLKADRCREEYNPCGGMDIPVRSTSVAIDGSYVAIGTHRGKMFIYNMNDKYVRNTNCLLPISSFHIPFLDVLFFVSVTRLSCLSF